MITVIISGGPGTGEPTTAEHYAAAVEALQKLAQEVDQVAREVLEALPKFRPPVEAGWPLPIPESPRTGATGWSGRAPTILEICQRYPAGFD